MPCERLAIDLTWQLQLAIPDIRPLAKQLFRPTQHDGVFEIMLLEELKKFPKLDWYQFYNLPEKSKKSKKSKKGSQQSSAVPMEVDPVAELPELVM